MFAGSLIGDETQPGASAPALDGGAGSSSPAEVVVRSVKEGSVQSAEKSMDGVKDSDRTRLVDAAKCEVYVCFEGPLRAHFKLEVKEEVWKGDYVEIFSSFHCYHWKSSIWIGG